MDSLNPLLDRVTIHLSVQQYNDLIERIRRLEGLIMDRREVCIKETAAIEDAFGLPRTKEKRVR